MTDWGALFIPHAALLAAFAGTIIYAMQSDFRHMVIPNEVSIAILFLFVPVAGIAGLDMQSLLMHLGAGLMMFIIGIVLFALRMFGGGDVKMLAAVAVWAGFDNLLPLLLMVTIIGGVLSLAILGIKRSQTIATSFGALPWLHGEDAQRNHVPYGIAIGLAILYLLPQLPLFI